MPNAHNNVGASLDVSPRAVSLQPTYAWPPLQSVWYYDTHEFLFPATTHCCAMHSATP